MAKGVNSDNSDMYTRGQTRNPRTGQFGGTGSVMNTAAGGGRNPLTHYPSGAPREIKRNRPDDTTVSQFDNLIQTAGQKGARRLNY